MNNIKQITIHILCINLLQSQTQFFQQNDSSSMGQQLKLILQENQDLVQQLSQKDSYEMNAEQIKNNRFKNVLLGGSQDDVEQKYSIEEQQQMIQMISNLQKQIKKLIQEKISQSDKCNQQEIISFQSTQIETLKNELKQVKEQLVKEQNKQETKNNSNTNSNPDLFSQFFFNRLQSNEEQNCKLENQKLNQEISILKEQNSKLNVTKHKELTEQVKNIDCQPLLSVYQEQIKTFQQQNQLLLQQNQICLSQQVSLQQETQNRIIKQDNDERCSGLEQRNSDLQKQFNDLYSLLIGYTVAYQPYKYNTYYDNFTEEIENFLKISSQCLQQRQSQQDGSRFLLLKSYNQFSPQYQYLNSILMNSIRYHQIFFIIISLQEVILQDLKNQQENQLNKVPQKMDDEIIKMIQLNLPEYQDLLLNQDTLENSLIRKGSDLNSNSLLDIFSNMIMFFTNQNKQKDDQIYKLNQQLSVKQNSENQCDDLKKRNQDLEEKIQVLILKPILGIFDEDSKKKNMIQSLTQQMRLLIIENFDLKNQIQQLESRIRKFNFQLQQYQYIEDQFNQSKENFKTLENNLQKSIDEKDKQLEQCKLEAIQNQENQNIEKNDNIKCSQQLFLCQQNIGLQIQSYSSLLEQQKKLQKENEQLKRTLNEDSNKNFNSNDNKICLISINSMFNDQDNKLEQDSFNKDNQILLKTINSQNFCQIYKQKKDLLIENFKNLLNENEQIKSKCQTNLAPQPQKVIFTPITNYQLINIVHQ